MYGNHGSAAEHSLKEDMNEKNMKRWPPCNCMNHDTKINFFSFATIRDKIRQETKSRIFKAQFGLSKKGTRGDSTGIHWLPYYNQARNQNIVKIYYYR